MVGIAEIKWSSKVLNPELLGIEIVENTGEAISRANELLRRYIDKYGEEYYEIATVGNPFALAQNGDVTWKAYISDVECNSVDPSLGRDLKWKIRVLLETADMHCRQIEEINRKLGL